MLPDFAHKDFWLGHDVVEARSCGMQNAEESAIYGRRSELSCQRGITICSSISVENSPQMLAVARMHRAAVLSSTFCLVPGSPRHSRLHICVPNSDGVSSLLRSSGIY